MNCSPDPAAREHLHQARTHLHEAVRIWSDQLVDPQVRGHLRQAARSVLNAGLAAVDAADRRAAERHKPAQPAS